MLSYCTSVTLFLLSLSSSLRPGNLMNAIHHPNYCITMGDNSSISPSSRVGNKPSTSTFGPRNQTSKCPLKSNLSQSIWLSDNGIAMLGPICVSLEIQRDVWLVQMIVMQIRKTPQCLIAKLPSEYSFLQLLLLFTQFYQHINHVCGFRK